MMSNLNQKRLKLLVLARFARPSNVLCLTAVTRRNALLPPPVPARKTVLFLHEAGRPAPGSGFEFPQSPQKYDRYSQGQPILQQISLLFSSDFPLDNAIRNGITLLIGLQLFGEVLERLNRPVSKTGVGVTPPWVRIPPSPSSDLQSGIRYPRLATKTSYFIFQTATAIYIANRGYL